MWDDVGASCLKVKLPGVFGKPETSQEDVLWSMTIIKLATSQIGANGTTPMATHCIWREGNVETRKMPFANTLNRRAGARQIKI